MQCTTICISKRSSLDKSNSESRMRSASIRLSIEEYQPSLINSCRRTETKKRGQRICWPLTIREWCRIKREFKENKFRKIEVMPKLRKRIKINIIIEELEN